MEETTPSSASTGAQTPNGMATASLVLGIVALALCFVAYISIPCGILAIIFSVLAKNKIKNNPQANYAGSGAATAGLITGILGLLIALLIIIIAIVFVASVVEGSQEFNDAMQQIKNSMDTLRVN
jgi:ABC-type Fe3+ transport system permease subunit